MIVALSVVHQQWSAPEGRVARGALMGVPRDGLLVLVDWERLRVIRAKRMDSPSGVCCIGRSLVVASMFGGTLVELDRTLEVRRVFVHPQFTDLHTVSATQQGLLIVSTGVDGIFEVGLDGRVLWSWLGASHGLAYTMDGRRVAVNPWHSYREGDPQTSLQAAHLNSAARRSPKEVVATLFHQGAVVSIGGGSQAPKRTVSGLSKPHAIRRRAFGGWSLCNTGCDAVVLLDKAFKPEMTVRSGFSWPQDAVEYIPNKVLVLDANNARIVEVDAQSGEVERAFRFPDNWKGFGLEVLPPEWEPLSGEGGGAIW